MKKATEKVGNLWSDALMDAADNYSGVENDGEVKLSAREDYNKPITAEDVKVLQSIPRKSINRFTSEELDKTSKWAYKSWKELGPKSPFFRAWFGEWRAHDKTSVKPISVSSISVDEAIKKNAYGRIYK